MVESAKPMATRSMSMMVPFTASMAHCDTISWCSELGSRIYSDKRNTPLTYLPRVGRYEQHHPGVELGAADGAHVLDAQRLGLVLVDHAGRVPLLHVLQRPHLYDAREGYRQNYICKSPVGRRGAHVCRWSGPASWRSASRAPYASEGSTRCSGRARPAPPPRCSRPRRTDARAGGRRPTRTTKHSPTARTKHLRGAESRGARTVALRSPRSCRPDCPRGRSARPPSS